MNQTRLPRALLLPVAALALCATLFGARHAQAGLLGGISIEGAAIKPLGPWNDGVGFGFGALLAAEFEAIPVVSVTGRVGYLPHLSKDILGTSTSVYEVPVLIGGKYYPVGKLVGFYLGAELGVAYLGSKVGENSSSDNNLGFTIGAGLKQGPFDLRAQLYSPKVKDISDIYGVMFTLGYTFLSL